MLLIILVCPNVFAKDDIKGTLINQYELEETQSQTEIKNKVYLGNYQITFYCSCSACCGAWSGGGTASGTTPTPYYTIACGQEIPFGTEIYIEGLGTYVCEDRGVPNGWIDVFVNSHEQALQLGLQYKDCYIIES